MFSATRALGVLGLLAATGCATPPPAQILTPFLEDDFQSWKLGGPYTLTGQAFLKRPDGRIITCAGETVSLLPAVGYNTELEKILESGKGYPPNYERNARKYEHKTTCDGSGRFSFDSIAALNWIVVTRVTWQEPSSIPYMSPDDKGGYLFSEFRVGDTHTALTLSNPDFVADAP